MAHLLGRFPGTLFGHSAGPAPNRPIAPVYGTSWDLAVRNSAKRARKPEGHLRLAGCFPATNHQGSTANRGPAVAPGSQSFLLVPLTREGSFGRPGRVRMVTSPNRCPIRSPDRPDAGRTPNSLFYKVCPGRNYLSPPILYKVLMKKERAPLGPYRKPPRSWADGGDNVCNLLGFRTVARPALPGCPVGRPPPRPRPRCPSRRRCA